MKDFGKHSNEIANQNPEQYSRVIETYIFKHNWEYKFGQELRDMCEKIGDGMCDEIICDLELQMRICNGEATKSLVGELDKLPYVRFIKLRNGDVGFLGGVTPAKLTICDSAPNFKRFHCVPYAFRKEPSKK